jgi:hypothetical protein
MFKGLTLYRTVFTELSSVSGNCVHFLTLAMCFVSRTTTKLVIKCMLNPKKKKWF